MNDKSEPSDTLDPENPHQLWTRLEGLYLSGQLKTLKQQFADHPERAKDFFLQQGSIALDYSRNHINADIMSTLFALARTQGMQKKVRALFAGEKVNESEDRRALHLALRNPGMETLKDSQLSAEINRTLERMKTLSEQLSSGEVKGASGKRINHLLHIGIGGSYLGPRVLDEALSACYERQIDCDFLANIDANQLDALLQKINPDTTLVIVASKTFTTQETMVNAEAVKAHFLNYMSETDWRQHLIGVTENSENAQSFGVDPGHLFPVWDAIGGRYSLWSAMGLPLCLSYGYDTFTELLDGARQMDQHFISASPEGNMPLIMALVSFWYTQFFNTTSQAIVPYDHSLRLLPAHLQQLVMESNGKSVRQDGSPVSYSTCPVIWGGEGTNGQHAFHQLLHQGTQMIPVDFILPLSAGHDRKTYQDLLVANCLGQSLALMNGREKDSIKEELLGKGMDEEKAEYQSKHMACPGNRPSSVILLRDLKAATLGSLIALYEHKVFCEAVMWQINPFDQWGVELGKTLGDKINRAMSGGEVAADLDASTRHLLSIYQSELNLPE